jgi:polar amino acid transport system permease protein
MNRDVIVEYVPLYVEALGRTVHIGLVGILGAILLGLGSSLILYFQVRGFRRITRAYIELFRNTPLLVQLFFLYFGLPKLGLRITADFCGMLGLALIGGSYMAETFRSGLEAVDRIQFESAKSLGMTPGQTFFYVILPQAVSTSVPGFVANMIFLLKETSVFSAISVMDLMFTAKDLIGMEYKTMEALTLLVVFYLIMLLPVSVLGSIVERRVRYGSYGD